jgi:hypothetical protein
MVPDSTRAIGDREQTQYRTQAGARNAKVQTKLEALPRTRLLQGGRAFLRMAIGACHQPRRTRSNRSPAREYLTLLARRSNREVQLTPTETPCVLPSLDTLPTTGCLWLNPFREDGPFGNFVVARWGTMLCVCHTQETGPPSRVVVVLLETLVVADHNHHGARC